MRPALRPALRTARIVAPALAAALVMSGCQAPGRQTARAPDEQRQPGRIFGAPAPGAERVHMTTASMAFPTGEQRSSVVLVEKSLPRTVLVGQEFEYEVTVTNLTDHTLTGVVLREFTHEEDLRTHAAPEPIGERTLGVPERRFEGGPGQVRRGDRGGEGGTGPADLGLDPGPGDFEEHHIGTLGPRESRVIRARGEAADLGTLLFCTTVSYAPLLCATTEAIAPELELTKEGPEEAAIGEPIRYTLRVRNTGVGAASGVVIVDPLPEGMMADGDRDEVRFDAGTLDAGQVREFTLTARPDRPGEFINRAVARSDEGLRAEASAATVVRSPRLRIRKLGPEEDYTHIETEFRISVKNEGDGSAHNVVITDGIPEGVMFVDATHDGRLRGREAVWNLGTLNPGEERSVGVRIRTATTGTLENCATATAQGLRPVQDCWTVRLVGIPAANIQVVDLDDPVRVGADTRYSVTVVNPGSAELTNLGLEVELDEGVRFISSTGASPAGAPEGNTVAFGPVPRLGPGERATWGVLVVNERPGDVRFRVRVSADQLGEAVEAAEPTRVFAPARMEPMEPEPAPGPAGEGGPG